MDLLLKYSPFATKKQLLDQFDKIENECGTYICIYNLKLNSNGESEMIFTDNDICMNELKVDYDRK
jgi:hypothetical protein